MIGEYLYGLNEQELVSQPALQRRIERWTASASTTFVSADSAAVPQDKVYMISNAAVLCIGGAAQTVTRLYLSIINEQGSLVADIIAQFVPPTAATINGWQLPVNIPLMPFERLQVGAGFSAGVAANTVIGSTIGFFLPKGNVQLR